MGKKKSGFSSLMMFKTKDSSKLPSCYSSSPTAAAYCSPSSSSWPWPSCKTPKTTSFGRDANADAIYKTVNSVFFDTAESYFTHSSDERAESFSTASDDTAAGESLETVVRGLRSDRLFFEPGRDTSSILEEAKVICCSAADVDDDADDQEIPFKESVAMAMDSDDPYSDFRLSMEEMVAAHGLKDWEGLEELLLWYLRVNGKKTHGYIVGAFVDLLVGLANSPSSSSSSSSPCSNNISSFEIEEITEEKEFKEKILF